MLINKIKCFLIALLMLNKMFFDSFIASRNENTPPITTFSIQCFLRRPRKFVPVHFKCFDCNVSRITHKNFSMPTQICMFCMYDICCRRSVMSSRPKLLINTNQISTFTADLYTNYWFGRKGNIDI